MNPLALVTRGYLCPDGSGSPVVVGMAPEVSGDREKPHVIVDEISAPRAIGKAKPLDRPVIKPRKK